jgi:hypothetical protein
LGFQPSHAGVMRGFDAAKFGADPGGPCDHCETGFAIHSG